MEYTTLGQTDLYVSKLGLGGAQLPDLSDDLVHQIVHTSLECGINFFDTAPLYGMGSSETKLGKALQGKRDQVVLTTKTLDRQSIPSYDATMSSIEGSLTRLGTDYIDLIQIHEPEYFAFEDRREVVWRLLRLDLAAWMAEYGTCGCGSSRKCHAFVPG
jgi:L-galactose dehydrogenase